MANLVVHFEIYAEDIERAADFYRNVFGWAFQTMGEMNYTLVFPSGEVEYGPAKKGINGGLLLRPGLAPQDTLAAPNAFVCTIGVDDIDASVEAAERHGGHVDMAITLVENVGRLAYLRDTEGNLFGVLEPLPMTGQ